MNGPWRSGCERHRAALHDFVDHRAGYDPGSSRGLTAALDHLERCRDCEEELAATALVIAALRRLANDVRSAEPSPDAWVRLAGRIEQPRPRRVALTSPLAGLALSAGLVVAILAPQFGLALVQPTGEGTATAPGSADAAAFVEEQRWLRDRTSLSARSTSPQPTVATPSRPRDRGPDGMQLGATAPHYGVPEGRQL